MLPVKSIIRINKGSEVPVFLQIANSFIREIQNGVLKPGLKLPGSRVIANQLGVHRKTVVAAFDELLMQGWITSVASRGTFISDRLPAVNYQELKGEVGKGSMPNLPGFELHSHSFASKPLMINHKMLTINDGFPDGRLAPADLIGKAYRSVIGRGASKSLLSYSEVEGNEMLRNVLADYLNETRGLNIGKENMLITRGSQMGIYITAKTILAPGNEVVVGETSYFVANMAFKSLGAILRTVPVDENGIDVEAVGAICRLRKVRAVFITSHHHHPTTVTLSAERRLKLLQLAETFRFAIVEDDYDYDFHYAGSPLLPLASADRGGFAIYIGSFTKTVAPFIRTGYIVAPAALIAEIALVRRIIDRQGDPVLEQALAELIREGDIRRHLAKTLRTYRHRRDFFCTLLKDKLRGEVEFKTPEGGMAVWVKFADDINFDSLVMEASKRGLHINHASVYNPDSTNLNSTRMGFASLNEEEMERAIGILTMSV